MNAESPAPEARNEGVMWVALAVCLVAGAIAPFFGDSTTAQVLPFLVAVAISFNLAWRRNHPADDTER